MKEKAGRRKTNSEKTKRQKRQAIKSRNTKPERCVDGNNKGTVGKKGQCSQEGGGGKTMQDRHKDQTHKTDTKTQVDKKRKG